MKKIVLFIFVFFIGITTYNALSDSLSLTGISLAGASLEPKFNSQTTQYRARVKNDVKTINIGANLKDKKSTIVSGIGTKKELIVGNNRFEIKVRDINRNESTYVVVISREDAEGNIPTHSYSGVLKDLKVDEYSIFFDQNGFEYNIEVPNNVTKLNINAIPLESNLKVEVLNNENFIVGNNIVTINTKDGSNIIRTYIINVKRKDIVEISREKNIYQILKNSNEDPIKIELEVPQMLDGVTLEYLVNTQKNVVFEYLNDNKKTHSMEIYHNNIANKNMDIVLQSDINAEYKYKDKDSILLDFKQDTFPGKVKINVFTKDIYNNNDIIELYKKEKENYTKLTELKMSDDKLSFNITKGGQYLLTLKDKEIIEKQEKTKETIIISILGLLNVLAIVRLIKVIRK